MEVLESKSEAGRTHAVFQATLEGSRSCRQSPRRPSVPDVAHAGRVYYVHLSQSEPKPHVETNKHKKAKKEREKKGIGSSAQTNRKLVLKM